MASRRDIFGRLAALGGLSTLMATTSAKAQTRATDSSGKSLAGDFDAQVRQVFANLGATLEEAGGKLSDMVTMTVFITDPRNHPRMTAIRREIFGKDFPASASIAISHLASPNALLEIQGVAVIPV
jgi:2-iminobutanoate/2-iminopropanoate deaminase